MKKLNTQTAKRIALIAFAIVTSTPAWAGENAPNYFAVPPGSLAEVKARLKAGDESLQPALKDLLKSADAALQKAPTPVVEKTKTPPSGDKHDYMTTATYYWPDPQKPDGLPYIRHDGKVNPETRGDAYDYERMTGMGKTVPTLALAYYFSGKEAYADQAAKHLRAWFLDPATRMNPHLDFAQGIPGTNTGRGTGIIEGRNIAQAADAAQLLAGSAAWTSKDQTQFKAWLETYLDWLLTSKNGLDEAKAKNNHGTWYDVQALELALVLGKMDVAKQLAEAAREKRVAVQIEPDGKQPLEVARAASLAYSRFNLEALYTLATMCEHVGVDLWHYQLADGKFALATALDYLMPYVTDPSKKWPFDQIKDIDRSDFAQQLRQAGTIYHEPTYEKTLLAFPDLTKKRHELLFPASAKHNLPDSTKRTP